MAYYKKMRKANNAIMGGAMLMQGTRLLSDTSPSGTIGTAQGFVGLGVAGAMSGVAFDMIGKGFKKQRKR